MHSGLHSKVHWDPVTYLDIYGITRYYRPQRSWGKVIFSQACVILFTGGLGAWSGGGGGVGECMVWVVHSPGGRVPGPGGWVGAWSGGVPGLGVHGPGGVPGLGVPGLGGACCRGGAGGLVETPPRRLLLRAVSILLECILVNGYSLQPNSGWARHRETGNLALTFPVRETRGISSQLECSNSEIADTTVIVFDAKKFARRKRMPLPRRTVYKWDPVYLSSQMNGLPAGA